jgi:hypothetical protein
LEGRERRNATGSQLWQKLARPCLKIRPGMVMHMTVPATGEMEVGGSLCKTSLGKISTSPYLENKLEPKVLGTLLKWYRICQTLNSISNSSKKKTYKGCFHSVFAINPINPSRTSARSLPYFSLKQAF